MSDDAAARERRALLSDGARTVVQQWGDAGPIVVGVHGLGSSRRGWARIGERLSDRYRVVAYDQRGHGDSDAKGPMTLERSVADLGDVVASLGEPVHAHELEPTTVAGGACVRFLVAPRGVLVEVEGVEQAFTVGGVRAIRVYRRPGHVFGELLRASDRSGMILATGKTRAEADAAAAESARRVRFVTVPAEAVA